MGTTVSVLDFSDNSLGKPLYFREIKPQTQCLFVYVEKVCKRLSAEMEKRLL